MRPIEDIAREAGLAGSDHCDCAWPWLERFAAIVRAEALEEAAEIAENTWEADEGGDEESSGFPRYGENSARAIRRLKDTK